MYSNTFRALMLTYGGVEIGLYSYGPVLSPGCLPEGTRIGRYCSLASGITIFRRNHPIHRVALHPFFYNAAFGMIPKDSIHADRDRPLVIEDDVWIGANTVITPGCTLIGRGAIVAAGSVVTKNVPAFTVVGGNPARHIKDRFAPEIREIISASHWWDRAIEQLTPVMPLFLEDATLENARRLATHLSALEVSR